MPLRPARPCGARSSLSGTGLDRTGPSLLIGEKLRLLFVGQPSNGRSSVSHAAAGASGGKAVEGWSCRFTAPSAPLDSRRRRGSGGGRDRPERSRIPGTVRYAAGTRASRRPGGDPCNLTGLLPSTADERTADLLSPRIIPAFCANPTGCRYGNRNVHSHTGIEACGQYPVHPAVGESVPLDRGTGSFRYPPARSRHAHCVVQFSSAVRFCRASRTARTSGRMVWMASGTVASSGRLCTV